LVRFRPGDAVGGKVGVGGKAVGTIVGGGLVGMAVAMVSVGSTTADGGVGVDAQAATKTTAKMRAII
jgi:hypothetical protein